MKMKKKKYATGGVINNYMPNPSEVLTQDSINKAKAKSEAEQNPWATILPMLGTVAGGYASQGGFTNKEASTNTAFGQFATQHFANGGMTGMNLPEAEGGEMIETPTGEVSELKGPSHEKGGIPLLVPPGTKVYSDRLKIGGKTMAERKEAREKKIDKLDTAASKNVTDIALKNAKARTIKAVEAEEAQDLAIQQMANMYGNLNEFAMGTGAGGIGDLMNLLLRPQDPNAPLTAPNLGTPPSNGVLSNSANYAADQEALATESFTNTAAPLTPQAAITTTQQPGGYNPSIGDFTGLAGNLVSTFGPLRNTLNSRATDTPNVNSFANFGQDALNANDQMGEYVKSQEANALKRIRSNANTSKRSARNSARGVNTQRALDLAIDSGVNDAELDAQDAFSRQMMSVLGQQAQLENQQDSAVMQGEYQRDQADRQDKDNFYSNKARDIATIGQGLQETGKDINAIKSNDDTMKLLNSLSKYFQFDKQGNIIGINQTT